jgi:chaperonin GroEL
LHNAQVEFLHDLAAITGATVFDPVNHPLDRGTLEDLGPGVTTFESSRFRSTIIGRAANLGQAWEDRLLERIDTVEQQLAHPESEIDRILLGERLGKLTGGIAKLKVIGASNGELKEKRDRAEDAVCAVRGAIKHGCLPGGGWSLLRLVAALPDNPINNEILKPALMEPVHRLLFNIGLSEYDQVQVLEPVLIGIRDGKTIVYNAETGKHGDAVELGVLDSTPAVLEAIRNALSIAGLLGTLGGCVVFARDSELERTEAKATQAWLRDANGGNPADERG